MSKKLKDESPLALSRYLAQRELLENAVPLVVHGYLDLDEALELLKRGVAVGFERVGGTKTLHGHHLSRSDRWIHRYLTAGLGGDRRKAGRGEWHHIRALAQESLGPGYRFMLRILTCFCHASPSGLTLDEVRASAKLEDWQVSDVSLRERLDLYARMGLLYHEPLVEGTGWRASALLLNTAGIAGGEPRWGPWLFPLKLANLTQPRTFTHIRVRLSRSGMRRLQERVATALQEGVAAELVEGGNDTEENLSVDIVLAIGSADGVEPGS